MKPICSHSSGSKGLSTVTSVSGEQERGIMLFGVRVMPASSSCPTRRRSVSMTNLTHLNASRSSNISDDGYFSDAPRSRRVRRGTPWTEEEHRRFLRGLHELGKGDWRGISRNYVKTRTPTQVASHAQKYFLRLNSLHTRPRRGPSLFDITTHSLMEAQESPSMATLPVMMGESSGASCSSAMYRPVTIRMVPPPPPPPPRPLRMDDLSLDDDTVPPELFLSLAMPSSPSSSDYSNSEDA